MQVPWGLSGITALFCFGPVAQSNSPNQSDWLVICFLMIEHLPNILVEKVVFHGPTSDPYAGVLGKGFPLWPSKNDATKVSF